MNITIRTQQRVSLYDVNLSFPFTKKYAEKIYGQKNYMATYIEEPAFFNLCDPLDGLSSIMPAFGWAMFENVNCIIMSHFINIRRNHLAFCSTSFHLV